MDEPRSDEDHQLRLQQGVTDAQKAAAHRNKLMPVLEEACRIMDEIGRDGMVCNFNLGLDANGRRRVQNLDITKSLL